MPRIVFNNLKSLAAWLLKMNADKFQIYITSFNEVIAEPLKSTRPIRYGYYRIIGDVGKEIETMEKILPDFSYLSIRAYEWDSDKQPGIQNYVED